MDGVLEHTFVRHQIPRWVYERHLCGCVALTRLPSTVVALDTLPVFFPVQATASFFSICMGGRVVRACEY